MAGIDFMTETFCRVPDVFDAPLDDSVLIMNVSTGRYHGLNPVAGRIWEMLATPVSATELVARLVEEYEVSPEECETSVQAFLDHLRARELVTLQ